MKLLILITLLLPNLALAAISDADRITVVQAPSRTLGPYASAPSFPITHGVNAPTKAELVNADGSTSRCAVNETQVTGCILPDPIDATNQVKIIVYGGANGAPLVSATDTREGAVSLGDAYTWSAPQTFSGGFDAGPDKVKTQIKFLSTNVSSNNTVISDLTFNNLVDGKRYRVVLSATISQDPADATAGVKLRINGSDSIKRFTTPGSLQALSSLHLEYEFVASGPTTLTFVTDSFSGATNLTSATDLTYARLFELNNYVESTDF